MKGRSKAASVGENQQLQHLFPWLWTSYQEQVYHKKTVVSTAAPGGFSPHWRVTLTTPVLYLKSFLLAVVSCIITSRCSACQTHHDPSLAAGLQKSLLASSHLGIRPEVQSASHTHVDTHTHIHISSQLKPSCHASVMGRSAAATAMKDNIIKLDISGSKANSLSTVIRVMHWHSPPRGRFNCVQTHTLTCKQTHTPPRTCVCVCDAAE